MNKEVKKLGAFVLIILLFKEQALACSALEGDRGSTINGEVEFIKNCHITKLHEGKEVVVWDYTCTKMLKRTEARYLEKNPLEKGKYCMGTVKSGEELHDVMINIPCPESGKILDGKLWLRGCSVNQFFVKGINEKEPSKTQ